MLQAVYTVHERHTTSFICHTRRLFIQLYTYMTCQRLIGTSMRDLGIFTLLLEFTNRYYKEVSTD